MTGPQFLVLYVSLAAVVVVVAGFVRHFLRGPSGAPAPPPSDPYVVAFLAEGYRGGTEAAIVALAARGMLQPQPDRRLAVVAAQTAWLHPVEQAVYTTALQSGPAGATTSAMQTAAQPALVPAEQWLQQAGLVLTDGQRRNVRAVPAAIVLVAAVVGGVRLALGMAAGHAVGYLIALLVVTILIVLRFLGTPKNLRTRSGDRALANLRRSNAALRTNAFAAAAVVAATDVALAVALWGPGALTGSPLAGLSGMLRPVASGSGGSSDGGSSCSGGSCGGGCGGGCGG